jgi:hypothetical protein
MPLVKLHVLEGQYDEARLGKVSSAVQNGLISGLGIPPEDFFQIIHVLPRSPFRHTPSFLGLKALNDAVVAAGVSPDDLLIALYETPGENVSFGRGLAQRAHVADQYAAAAQAAEG